MKLKLLIIFSFLSWGGVVSQDCQDDYTNTIFCQDVQDNVNCITCSAGGGEDVGLPCEGVKLSLFETADDMCGWCPETCVPYIEEGGKCWKEVTGSQLYGICGPGLTCVVANQAASCVKMTDSPDPPDCLVQQAKFDQRLESGELGMDQRRPDCDAEGDWAPVQCSGAGVCRCVSKDSGQPLFGLETNMTAVDGMTCGCARQAHTLKELGCSMKVKYDGDSPGSRERFSLEYQECMKSQNTEYFNGQLRCDPNGNFDTAQCISQTSDDDYNPSYDLETCFCYYEGHPLNGSMAPINIAGSVLQCHREGDLHYPGYYRPCEKYQAENRKRIAEYKALGRVYISKPRLEICDIDGFYAKVQRDPNNTDFGFCSDKLGQQISSYRWVFSEMDCECAFVESLTTVWGESPACSEDGSYLPVQCKAGKCYCVDKYGRQCQKEVPLDMVDSLPCKGEEEHHGVLSVCDLHPTLTLRLLLLQLNVA